MRFVLPQGMNNQGQAGVGNDTGTIRTLTPVAGLDKLVVTMVACPKNEGKKLVHKFARARTFVLYIPSLLLSGWHTLFLTKSGEVYACGSNAQGVLGVDTQNANAREPGTRHDSLPLRG